MRIAYALFDRPNYCGGPTINARRLLPEFVRRGHRVTALVLQQHGGGDAVPELLRHGVECRTIEAGASTERTVEWFLRQLQDVDPDVFVPNVISAAAYAGRWAKEAGVPTAVWHVSDDEFNWAMVDAFACGEPTWSASGLVCISRELTERTRRRRPHGRVATIAHGSPSSDRVADQSGPLRLAYSGRFVQEQKRIRETAAAIHRVVAKYPDAAADLLGDGPDWTEVRDFFAEQPVGRRVTMPGLVGPHDLGERLAQSQVLVLLSDYEGLPGAVIDAMMCGLVPVCLRCPGGLTELVEHERTGLLVEDREADFDAAIARLEQDPALRRRLAGAAREHATAHYSVEAVADAWERFFDELLADAEPRREIRIPRRLDLPPPLPGLMREDVRRGNWMQEAWRWGMRNVRTWSEQAAVW